MRTRTRCAVAVLVAALVLIGCGSTARNEHVFSTTEIVNGFREQTGMRLIRDSDYSNEMWDQLDIDGDPDYEWGHWSLYVVKGGGSADLLKTDDGRDLQPDADGIYWYFEDDEIAPGWWLNKRYGDNVVVRWVGDETREASLDERFDRVDTALRAIVG